MIDRRNISYTQGSPLTPIHKGKLLITVEPEWKKKYRKGDVISRGTDVPPSVDETHEKDETPSPIPFDVPDVATDPSLVKWLIIGGGAILGILLLSRGLK